MTENIRYSLRPRRQGLYDPTNEHDACGVGFVAHVKGQKNHQIIAQGLQILENLTHRGATGADPLAGDGAGILIQMPDEFLRRETAAINIELPAPGFYGVGMLFLPQAPAARAECERVIKECILAESQEVLGWRDVPTCNDGVGEGVKAVEPYVRQVFIGRGDNGIDQDVFER